MRGKSLRSCIARKKKKKIITIEDVLITSRYGICEIPRIATCVWREEKLWKCFFFFSFSIYQFKRNLNFSCSEFIKSMYFKLNVWKLVSISERKIDLSNKILTITSCNYCYNSFKNISNYWLVAMKSIQNIYCIFTLFSEASITIKI